MDYLIEFDYDADEDDELTIRKGDIVNNTKTHEDGWMMGVLRGKEGVFPSNFGKPLKEERRKSQEDNLITTSTEENKHHSHIKDEDNIVPIIPVKKVTGVGFGNIFSGGEIKLKTTIKPKANSEESKPEIQLEKKPTNKPKEMVKVIHSYPAENNDELTLEIGDIITVLNKDDEDEGWWKGQKANGQIGVFPDNFVEPYKSAQEENYKSNRINASFNKTPPPPPVIAAKPKIGVAKTPPRPPQLSDRQITSVKPVHSVVNQEKDDGASFDAMNNHKPLVGPNAGRAKRPGKKLPANITTKTGSDEKLIDEDEKKIITQKSFTKDITFDIDTSITKQKSKEAPIEKNESFMQSKFKSKESTPTDKVNDNFAGNEIKLKEPISPAPGTFSSEKDLEISHINPKNNSKANTLPSKITIDKDNNTNNALVSKTDPDSEKNLSFLESKISDLEDENSNLRSDLSDLRKISNEQINSLKAKINKITNELDEEKRKRAANEIDFNRLKETVEDLESAMLSLSHK